MHVLARAGVLVTIAGLGMAAHALGSTLPSLYAHPTVEDAHGVIAPWHPGLNGPLDERVRIADYVLDYAQTPSDDPEWPAFPISTPTLGKAYGRCDPRGRNQLDLCAVLGTEMIRAHQLTGNPRYLDAARHWGDLFAAHCNPDPEEAPWDRYVDPSVVGWSDVLTGSTTLIANFLDDLIELGHTGTDGDTYSGAWAWPESSVCCGTSLSYNQYTAAPTLIRLGVLAADPWAREIGRRMILMATYDSDTNGVVKDGLFGEAVATGEWSNLAHPWPLCQALEAMAWMPRELAPNRENHLLRSSSVVQDVQYAPGRIGYRTFDAPPPAVDVLRLAFEPDAVRAGGALLSRRQDTDANGFVVERLLNGDCLVTIRHDGQREIQVTGPDPQRLVPADQLVWDGPWTGDGSERGSAAAGSTLTARFVGNQVRLIGRVDTHGGWADVYVDGVRQLTCVDAWNPAPRAGQVLFARSGLTQGAHELKLVVRGEGNPLSAGAQVRIEGVQSSAATGDAGHGSGGGPTGPQRMIFGYPKRRDYVDRQGHGWRPATEFVIRLGGGQDTVARSWWTSRRTKWVGNTPDPELYRYGVHGKEFKVNLTVGPGRYRVTLKWADTAETPWMERENGWNRVTRPTSVWINGESVLTAFDAGKAAGGSFRAVDRSFGPIEPRHGIIEVRFQGVDGRESMIQALALEPWEGQTPATEGGG